MQYHILSFEGPDPYSRAGGIATRVSGLAAALTSLGIETHLWFVGDPHRPGHEPRGRLHLHRWCQWISSYHPGGVYDGEEGKQADFAASLPPFLLEKLLVPYLEATTDPCAVLAEEWHTAGALMHLDLLLRSRGLRDRVALFWNANNTFGFDRIVWNRLAEAAAITTVSRYMRFRMWPLGLDPFVIPNGVSTEAFDLPERAAVERFRGNLRGRTILAKVARWDPDKRWLLAVAIVREMKRCGRSPLLIARGGVEAHGGEVLSSAAAAGLKVVERTTAGNGSGGLLECLRDLNGADIVSLRSPLDAEARRVLYNGSDAILANSGHEPFGLVALEAMAAGGLACTGGTGEDYVMPGWNALVLQTNDPGEFMSLFRRLEAHPSDVRALRRHGRMTAKQYSWQAIVRRNLVPRVELLARPGNGTRAGVGRKTAVGDRPSFRPDMARKDYPGRRRSPEPQPATIFSR